MAAIAGAAITLACASAASAATYFLHDVVFSDGATATGTFDTNVSGYPAGHDVTTTKGTLTGDHYAIINVTYSPGDSGITFNHDPDYDGFLKLVTVSPIDLGGVDKLVLGGASFECSSFSCPGGTARSVVSGYISTSAAAAAPEPATWGLMIMGLGAVGFALRRARKTAAFA